MQGSNSTDGIVQSLAATLQPTISLDLWGQISAAMLRTVEHDPTSVMQSLFTTARGAVHQVLHIVCVYGLACAVCNDEQAGSGEHSP